MNNGQRIKLRFKRLSDAKDDYVWQTDAELANLDATVKLEMSYRQYLSEFTFEMCYPSSNRHEFAIDTVEGEHIGNCVYYNVNQVERKAEMGIMIGNRNYWNKGYGVEAITALLNHVFIKTHMEKIYLTTLSWNIRAQKCFKKCGFNECGEVVRDDHNFLLMAIQRGQWLEMQKAAASSVQQPL